MVELDDRLQEVIFTYNVTWVPSSLPYSSRWGQNQGGHTTRVYVREGRPVVSRRAARNNEGASAVVQQAVLLWGAYS